MGRGVSLSPKPPETQERSRRPLKTAQLTTCVIHDDIKITVKPSSHLYQSPSRVTALPDLAYQPGGLPGLLLSQGDGRAHLEAGFPLRCLQRLSNPDVANLLCPWQDNRYTRGPFTPVLSY